jgi:hypothetical protein
MPTGTPSNDTVILCPSWLIGVARTTADLDNSETIQIAHLAEAIQYQSLDREGWAG